MEGFTDIQRKAYESAYDQIMNATEEELDEWNKEDNPDVSFETVEEKQNFRLLLEHAYIENASDEDCKKIYLCM